MPRIGNLSVTLFVPSQRLCINVVVEENLFTGYFYTHPEFTVPFVLKKKTPDSPDNLRKTHFYTILIADIINADYSSLSFILNFKKRELCRYFFYFILNQFNLHIVHFHPFFPFTIICNNTSGALWPIIHCLSESDIEKKIKLYHVHVNLYKTWTIFNYSWWSLDG